MRVKRNSHHGSNQKLKTLFFFESYASLEEFPQFWWYNLKFLISTTLFKSKTENFVMFFWELWWLRGITTNVQIQNWKLCFFLRAMRVWRNSGSFGDIILSFWYLLVYNLIQIKNWKLCDVFLRAMRVKRNFHQCSNPKLKTFFFWELWVWRNSYQCSNQKAENFVMFFWELWELRGISTNVQIQNWKLCFFESYESLEEFPPMFKSKSWKLCYVFWRFPPVFHLWGFGALIPTNVQIKSGKLVWWFLIVMRVWGFVVW